ncbi:MAG: hypothetical protein KJZ65_04445 [Phycisphaerales bacterium]|nr:hypothetical protein [Phycisphaerales bacterium]
MVQKPITIVEPGMSEAPGFTFEVNWWVLAPLAAATLACALVVYLAIRARLRVSEDELATRALVKRTRLDRKTRRALWRVADQLGMRDRAGVLLMSQSALLAAVGQLKVRQGDRKTAAAATTLVERLIGPVKTSGGAG